MIYFVGLWILFQSSIVFSNVDTIETLDLSRVLNFGEVFKKELNKSLRCSWKWRWLKSKDDCGGLFIRLIQEKGSHGVKAFALHSLGKKDKSNFV